ncbi:methionyl-tRNA formyltransferase [Naumannella halotolerans]|uniref:methionyl-tRNA formyltransferase n=1 Tax=Naumannella halotolerans TaxID=993414 RepID=UPI00105F8682|nr:methionyl-tRNA formyltransferase [Naumannella halotolerans]
MRVLLAGTPEVAVASLDALVDSDHQVLGVITRPDAPAGRGKKLRPSPVAVRAEELGLPVHKPEHPKDPDFAAMLTELAPDCVPVVAYGALVPQRVIDIPAHGWVNLHFSLLPRWRGAAPVQHAILGGDAETGACTFSLVRELDAGPVYGQIRTPIGPGDTAGDLLDRLARDGAGLLVRTLDEIAAGAVPRPQPDEGVTSAPKLTSDDARIDWDTSQLVIDRLIRGCNPAPGAWTTLRGQRFKIGLARPAPEQELPPGQLRNTGRQVLVGTADRALELLQVQPPGKKPMAAADWARGAQLADDQRFDDDE